MNAKHLPLVALFFASTFGAAAQTPESTESSSMQWANASSVSGVKFTLLGDVVADPWRPGGQTGAGSRDTLQWVAEFKPESGGSTLTESLELRSGQSGAAILVGDFVEIERAATSEEQLPLGHTKVQAGKLLRATVLKFPVGKTREPQYPVYLVNGDPENQVKVTVGGVDYRLDYAVPKSFKAPAGEHVKIKLSAVGLQKEIGFTIEPYDRGGVIGFYRTVDAERTAFVFVNLRSIESISERLKSTSGASEHRAE